MNRELIGQTLKTVRTKAHAAWLRDLERVLGTPSAAETARIALFFGFTIGRDLELPQRVGMVMERTLMLGHDISWKRPFEPDEEVDVTVILDEIQDKPDREIAIVDSIFSTPAGEEIQRQRSTFVTYKEKRAEPAAGTR